MSLTSLTEEARENNNKFKKRKKGNCQNQQRNSKLVHKGIKRKILKYNFKEKTLTVIKIAWYWQKNSHIDHCNRIEGSEIDLQKYSQLIFSKRAKQLNRERIIS